MNIFALEIKFDFLTTLLKVDASPSDLVVKPRKLHYMKS